MYKIGTISKFLGIPEHVLRFYEKKGLIESKHLGESPTRYYDEFDICLLMQIKQLRNLNFSVDEIRDIFEHQDKREDVNYYEVLSCKQQEVFDSIELLTRVQQRLIQMMDSFQINEKAKDQLVITDLPELFWIYNMDEVRSPESMRMDEGTNRIILGEINPNIRLMAFIDRENIEVASKQNSCRYEWGITFPTEFLFKIPENVRRQLFWIPPATYYVSSKHEEKDCILDQEKIGSLCRLVHDETATYPDYALVELLPGGGTNYMVPVIRKSE